MAGKFQPRVSLRVRAKARVAGLGRQGRLTKAGTGNGLPAESSEGVKGLGAWFYPRLISSRSRDSLKTW